MFDLKVGMCPTCGLEIRKSLSGDQDYECPACQKSYAVYTDKKTDKTWLVLLDDTRIVEPLNLPRGSLRAITTLVLAGCCWVLILLNRQVPGYLLGLLLTVIGYYFGFRKKETVAGSRVYDVETRADNPLFLPAGYIRVFLILGFLVSGGILLIRGQMSDLIYLEFFLILAGFIGGYVFTGFLGSLRDEPSVYNGMLHLKGIVLLGAVLALALMLLALYYQEHAYRALACTCLISFYFGSRS